MEMISILVLVHDSMDRLCASIYILLSVVALCSLFSPFLRELASHGKTRLITATCPAARNGLAERKRRVTGVWFQELMSHERFQVPKRTFLHFYAVGLMSCSFLLFFLPSFTKSKPYYSTQHHQPENLERIIPNTLLFIHLLRRCYECLRVHSWSTGGTMHVGGYILGLLHYVLLPVCFLPPPLSRYSFDDGHCTSSVISSWSERGVEGSCTSAMVRLAMGLLMLLCAVAQWEQYQHHVILSNCRRGLRMDRATSKLSRPSNQGTSSDASLWERQTEGKSSSYGIPTGRGFELVSCPHYLAEIGIYVSFVIMLYISFNSTSNRLHSAASHCPSVVESWDAEAQAATGVVLVISTILETFRRYKLASLLIWVVTNLTVSAKANHNWYLARFGDDYPKSRKMLFPWIW